MYQEIRCQNGCNFCYGPQLLNIKLQDLKDTCKLSIKTNSVVHYDPAHVNCKGEKRDGGSAIVSSDSGLRGAHIALAAPNSPATTQTGVECEWFSVSQKFQLCPDGPKR